VKTTKPQIIMDIPVARPVTVRKAIFASGTTAAAAAAAADVAVSKGMMWGYQNTPR
jgi:hypothetical protein